MVFMNCTILFSKIYCSFGPLKTVHSASSPNWQNRILISRVGMCSVRNIVYKAV